MNWKCLRWCWTVKSITVKKNIGTHRSSHQRSSVEKGILKSFAKFTGKHPCQILFLIKLQAQPAKLLKNWPWHKCLAANFAKFLRTLFLQDNSGQLLLHAITNLNKFQILPQHPSVDHAVLRKICKEIPLCAFFIRNQFLRKLLLQPLKI